MPRRRPDWKATYEGLINSKANILDLTSEEQASSERTRQTSVTAGTIFQDTRSPLRTWFAAAWYVTNQKQGVSALGLQRVLGLGSYETAWAWLHKLRRAMVRAGRDRLAGEVEVDESYVGGVDSAPSGAWRSTRPSS